MHMTTSIESSVEQEVYIAECEPLFATKEVLSCNGIHYWVVVACQEMDWSFEG